MEAPGIVWRDGMRDCDFCKDRNIPPQAKQHTDDKCPFASKEQIDALMKARAERRKVKQERYDTKKRGKNGSARLAQSSIDDDEVASGRFFGGDHRVHCYFARATLPRPAPCAPFAHLTRQRSVTWLPLSRPVRAHVCQPVLVHPRDA